MTNRNLRRCATSLKQAELRRLERAVVELELLADADPVLRPLLAASRACRAKLVADPSA